MYTKTLVLLLCCLFAACEQQSTSAPKSAQEEPTAANENGASNEKQPNILLIVADDLGYTDLGSFGGEISTPNLDRLAMSGTRLLNFHTSASCSPTRAMLMTGTDNHLAGMGSQGKSLITPLQKGHPAYQNKLSPKLKTIAKRLQEVGYRTYASTKWHLGDEVPQLPGRRGFDRSLALMEGGGGHFDDMPLAEAYGKAHWLLDDEPLELPEDFYSTVYMTDRLIEFIKTDERQTAPFFAYLGYTAPHWPLQAPREYLEKYQGYYEAGYEALLQARMTGAKKMKVVPETAQGVTKNAEVIPWDELSEEQKQGFVARMVAYAAMVHILDEQVGRLLEFLEQHGTLDNTIIIFMSDNGAEGHVMEERPTWKDWIQANFDNSLENIGNQTSYVTLGQGWARATAAPFRASKSKVSEGGIRVPAFVHFPESTEANGIVDNAFMTVMDLAPTFLELAGAESDEPDSGKSMARPVQSICG
ncbi:MAG: sulfatase-like hydrolase/transferase [Pseudomonadota bacterium]